MNSLDFFKSLIGEYDISSVDVTYNYNNVSIVIKFEWEMDCGCFSCKKDSTLTILSLREHEPILVNNIKNKQGKAYKYILNHKQYVGKLLDLKGENDD